MLLQWQGGKADEGVRQRSQRPADIVVDICQCFLRVKFDSYLIIRVDICYCNATVLSGID